MHETYTKQRKKTVLSIENKWKLIEDYGKGKSVSTLATFFNMHLQTVRDIVPKG